MGKRMKHLRSAAAGLLLASMLLPSAYADHGRCPAFASLPASDGLVLDYPAGRWGLGKAGDARLKNSSAALQGKPLHVYVPAMPATLRQQRLDRLADGLKRAGLDKAGFTVHSAEGAACGLGPNRIGLTTLPPTPPAATPPVPAPAASAATAPTPTATANPPAVAPAATAAPAAAVSVAPAASATPEAVAPVVAAPVAAAPVPWAIDKHLSLMQNLQRWAARAGWQFHWAVDTDFQPLAHAEFQGDFDAAVKSLFAALPGEYQLRVRLAQENRLMWVTSGE
jgi:hypothetical protein